MIAPILRLRGVRRVYGLRKFVTRCNRNLDITVHRGHHFSLYPLLDVILTTVKYFLRLATYRNSSFLSLASLPVKKRKEKQLDSIVESAAVPCPGCGSTVIRTLLVAKRARRECVGCARFVGWATEPIDAAIVAKATDKVDRATCETPGPSASDLTGGFTGGSIASCAGARPPSHPLACTDLPAEPPVDWLYVSKRLNLEWVPNTAFWSGDVMILGQTVFYRLTPRVLIWLEWAGQLLERQYVAKKLERSQIDAYLTAMESVWRFAWTWFSPAARQQERQQVQTSGEDPSLPEVTGPREPPPLICLSAGQSARSA